MLHSVASRITIATAIGAAAIGATLALFFVANSRLKTASDDNARAAAVSAAAFDLRAHVVDLDNAFQAVVLTGKQRFVTRWRAATRTWQVPATQLELATSNDSIQENRARQLRQAIDAYISDYGEPVIAIARISPATARSSTATEEGSLRIEQILRDTDGLARIAAANAASQSLNANDLARRATEAGVLALVVTPLLLAILGIWLARSVARPLRRAVDAAAAVSAGDFHVQLDERRSDEFGALARAFNAMTASLAASRDELISRANRLERAERHKSELISMVSHEVRTPLASVLGFTRLLLERDLDEDDRLRYLQIVDTEATRLASLVSDFLDARLIEDGQFALQPEPFDLGELVLEQAEAAFAHDGRHRVDLRIPEAPLPVDADRRRLAQVIGNVLSNAAKYSPTGGSIVVGAGESGGTARIWVEDQGGGIAPEHRGQIFQPFFRGGAPAAGIPGTGLGLAVSRRIVEAHRGQIGFDPLPGGTRFWIEIPVDAPSGTERLDDSRVTA